MNPVWAWTERSHPASNRPNPQDLTMSYILDALKRADAERERGHVPGLHTHNVPPEAAPRGRKNGWIIAAVLALAAIAVALTAWWMQPPAPAQPSEAGAASNAAMPAASQQQAPTTPDPTPAASPEPSAPPPVLAAPPEAVLPLLAPPPPAPLTTRPEAKSTVTSTPSASPEAPASASNSPSTQPPAAGAAAPAPVRSFAELSPEARAALPAVNVSGSTYSQNPAHRMLIANGKVVQEGQEVAPGLVLETIGPRSAVLNHRGLRYRIGY